MPGSSINCPICGRPVAISEPLLPFCSERCRLLDLGNWASGRYAIPVPFSENPLADDGDTEITEKD
ncbi:MAG: DNA gyrase inhibitor YacG, partial [Acidobacteria bacterium]|nr:DNA gyrase inhibitor YacG [Acidobacteriota bacterium]